MERLPGRNENRSYLNSAVEDQANDRTHRMGQKRSVQVYRYVTQIKNLGVFEIGTAYVFAR